MRLFFKIFLLLVFITSLYSHSSVAMPTLIGTIRSDTVHTQFGYRIVPLGDQNNDGYDDFITWGFDFRAYLYYGGTNLDTTTTYTLKFDSTQGRIDNVGDINSDGYDDFTMSGRSAVNWQMNLYHGGTSIDTIRDLWFGNDTILTTGYTTYSDDLDNDGNPEISVWSSYHSSVLIYNLGTDSDSLLDLEIYPANLGHNTGGYVGFGEGLISGDFNGDGIDDLVVNLRPRTQDSLKGQLYLYWGGATFDTIPDMIITRPGDFEWTFEKFGEVLEYLGDINGDSYDDFYAGNGNSNDTMGFIYFGGPNIDTIPDVRIYDYSERARNAGDLNGDGYNDLIISFPIYLSGLGYIKIFYGGPNMDSIPDITINNSDMPAWQQYFGNDCTGLGDVNGDGINDFAFSAVNAPGYGEIYIFSGTRPSTDIEYEFEPNLPDNFILLQNYPNPFNPSTTIEFQLPHREHITLSIYNTLGQKIRILINKELPVGSYSIEWDGNNDVGNKVSSGVYLYKLETSESTISKKMLLLK